MNIIQYGEAVYIVGDMLPAYSNWNTTIFMKQVPKLKKNYGKEQLWAFLISIWTYFAFRLPFKAADGLKYYDVVEGKGPIAEKGSTVQVWFCCKFN